MLSPSSEAIGLEKANELIEENKLHQALLQTSFRKDRSKKSRSRSRNGLRSGVETPSRFAGPEPHLPVNGVSPRHRVEFDLDDSEQGTAHSGPSFLGQHGARDDLYSPKRASGKSRIPKDRDLDEVKTPTMANLRHRHRSRSRDTGHRTFAVWGHDESSDSAASDSDA